MYYIIYNIMDDQTKIAIALRHYENMKKAMNSYQERKRQAKKENGTYRPPGRPRKVAVEGV